MFLSLLNIMLKLLREEILGRPFQFKNVTGETACIKQARALLLGEKKGKKTLTFKCFGRFRSNLEIVMKI